jgi:hypothetical protein
MAGRNVRLPDAVLPLAHARAQRAGKSLNAWLVELIGVAVDPDPELQEAGRGRPLSELVRDERA